MGRVHQSAESGRWKGLSHFDLDQCALAPGRRDCDTFISKRLSQTGDTKVKRQPMTMLKADGERILPGPATHFVPL